MNRGPNQVDGDGFPPRHDELYEAEFADEPRAPKKRVWLGVLLILLMIGVVVGPILYTGLSQEMARWRLAAAWEQRLDGDLDAAIASLDAAIAQNPDNIELLLQRANWKYENGDYLSALDDCDLVDDLSPGDQRMLYQRSQVFQQLGRHEEAVTDMERLLESGGISRWQALNAIAYARAVAHHNGANGQDLDRALGEINESINIGGEDPAVLDTRAFIQFQRGELDEALSDMNRAVTDMEADFNERQAMFDRNQAVIVDPRAGRLELESIKKSVAVLRYHRGLIHEALDNATEAEADFASVRELGFEPDPGLF